MKTQEQQLLAPQIEKLLSLEARYERLSHIVGAEKTDDILEAIYDLVDSCIHYGPTNLKRMAQKVLEIDKYYEVNLKGLNVLNGVIYDLYATALDEREDALNYDFGPHKDKIPEYEPVEIHNAFDPAAELLNLSNNISEIRNLKMLIEVKLYECG